MFFASCYTIYMNNLLKPNSKIGVFSPSSYVESDKIDAAKALMERRGFEVFIHPQTLARHNQSAGTNAEKIETLHALYRDESIDIIWAAGGGNRALHFVDELDYDLIRKHPKPMVGFSDVTALLNIISVKAGIANIHGPVFKDLPKYEALDTLLSGEFSMSFDQAHIIRDGNASGRLYGGNLSVFHYLPETLGADFLNGAILFLEDCNDEISRIDRMILHLKRTGVLQRLNGLVLGQFTDLGDGTRPYGFKLEDIIQEHLDGLNIPIVMEAPFGHGAHLYPIPVGVMANMDRKGLRIG